MFFDLCGSYFVVPFAEAEARALPTTARGKLSERAGHQIRKDIIISSIPTRTLCVCVYSSVRVPMGAYPFLGNMIYLSFIFVPPADPPPFLPLLPVPVARCLSIFFAILIAYQSNAGSGNLLEGSFWVLRVPGGGIRLLAPIKNVKWIRDLPSSLYVEMEGFLEKKNNFLPPAARVLFLDQLEDFLVSVFGVLSISTVLVSFTLLRCSTNQISSSPNRNRHSQDLCRLAEVTKGLPAA